jgi:hypothetical protein
VLFSNNAFEIDSLVCMEKPQSRLFPADSLEQINLSQILDPKNQDVYAIMPECLNVVQNGLIKDWHRFKLLDWLQQVCSCVGLRR